MEWLQRFIHNADGAAINCSFLSSRSRRLRGLILGNESANDCGRDDKRANTPFFSVLLLSSS